MRRIFAPQILAAILCVPAIADEPANLIENGGFEKHDKGKFLIKTDKKIDGKMEKADKDEVAYSFDIGVKKNGESSFCFKSRIENGGCELTSARVDAERGVKYEFKTDYIVRYDKASPAPKLSGRVMCLDKNGKVVKYIFPGAHVEPGKWLEFKLDFFAPEGTEKIAVTLWFSGKGEVNFDAMTLVATKAGGVAAMRHNFSRLAVANNDFAIWSEMPNVKIPREGMPEGLAEGGISMTCAKNESEPVQLVVTPKKDLKKVSLAFEDLKCKASGKTIPAENISFNPVGYITIANSEDPSLNGVNADPLLLDRETDVEKDKNQPFWVLVKTPEKTASGVYEGRIRVLSAGKEMASVPLSLRVRTFAIPEIPSLQSAFYSMCFATQMGQFDKRPSDQITDDIFSNLKKHRITGNQAYGVPAPKIKVADGKVEVTDWSKMDEFIGRLTGKYNMRWFKLEGLGFYGDNDGWKGWGGANAFGEDIRTEKGRDLLAQYTRLLGAHLREKGWIDMCVSYIWDEPPPSCVNTTKELAEAMHRGEPELNVFVTREITRELEGQMNTWCLPYGPGYIYPEKIRAAKKRGDKIWIYNWPVRLDTYSYINNRLFPWLAYLSGADGVLLWHTLFTAKGANPWTDMDKVGFNGGATLFYPHPSGKGPYISSQRFAVMKESIDDFDYFKILEARLDALCPGWGGDRVREIIASVVHEPPFKYHNDPSLLYHLRDLIGDEIDSLEKKPLLLARTSPPDNASTNFSTVAVSGLCAPGASVSVGDEPFAVAANGSFSAAVKLRKPGENKITIRVRENGVEKEAARTVRLEKDPKLAELKELLDKYAALGTGPSRHAAAHDKHASRVEYSPEDKAAVEKALGECKSEYFAENLRRIAKTAKNPLYNAVASKGVAASKTGRVDKVESYLAQLAKMSPDTDTSSWACSLEAVDFMGVPAYVLKNKRIELVVLENDGRIVDFKVGGVSCLRSAMVKDKENPDISIIAGGYEEMAGTDVKLNDEKRGWEIIINELKPDVVSLTAQVRIKDGQYMFSREMTVRKDDPRARLAYTIRNTMPAGFKSDDPHAYDFPWRAHPDIGIARSASEKGDPDGDILVVPTKDKLPCVEFGGAAKKTFYEIKNMPLTAQYAASFDPASKTGFAQLLDPQISSVYIWFHSGNSKFGDMKVYTIEPNKAIDVRPFVVNPGEKVSFTNHLAGFTNIGSAEDLAKAVESCSGKKF